MEILGKGFLNDKVFLNVSIRGTCVSFERTLPQGMEISNEKKEKMIDTFMKYANAVEKSSDELNKKNDEESQKRFERDFERIMKEKELREKK